MKQWFNLKKSADQAADIFILEQIGEDWWTGNGLTAKAFIDAVTALGDISEINLHINSPGGDVFDGLTIHNFLRRHQARVTVYIEGIAASIASVIAMAGDEIIMPRNTSMFIHNPWSMAAGDSEALRRTADDLDRIKTSLITAYHEKSGLEHDAIAALMDAETYLSAEDALAKGFANRIEEPIRIAASHDIGTAKAMAAAELRHMSALAAKDGEIANLRGELERLRPQPADAVACIQAANSLGLSAAIAADWVQSGISKQALDGRLAFAAHIKDVCAAANEDPAPYLDRLNDADALFCQAMINIKAAKDVSIDNGLTPEMIDGIEVNESPDDTFARRRRDVEARTPKVATK
jgi:ATP-dependent protease ClpP protease subunit